MPLLRSKEYRSLIPSFSTFMSVEKIVQEVIEKIISNERLKKLLYYTDKNALGLPELSAEQQAKVISDQIRIIPKLAKEKESKPYLIITLDDFEPIPDTDDRAAALSIDIICQYDHWSLGNFKLRPYAIAGELDGMINNTMIYGEQLATFVGAKQLLLNEELGGLSLYYLLHTDGVDKQARR